MSMDKRALALAPGQYGSANLQGKELDARSFAGLHDMREYIAAFEVAMKGKLEEEAKRLTKLIADHDARCNFAVETVEFKRQKQEFEADKINTQRANEITVEKVAQREKAVQAQIAECAQRERAVQEREAAENSREAQNEASHKASMAVLEAKHKEVDEKLAGIAHTQQVLHQRGVDLDKREDKVKAAMAKVNELMK